MSQQHYHQHRTQQISNFTQASGPSPYSGLLLQYWFLSDVAHETNVTPQSINFTNFYAQNY